MLTFAAAGCSDPGGAADSGSGRESSSSSGTSAPDRGAEASSQTEYQDRLDDCLRGLGIDVFEQDGQTQYEGEGFEEAIAACEAELGPPPAPAPLTDDEIISLYEQSLTAADCLEGLGYTISEPPSVERYIEAYRLSMSGGPPPWNPHSEVRAEVPSCPQPSLN